MVLSSPFSLGWLGFASFQCQARREVKQPFCARAQDPPSTARIWPPSPFLTTIQAAGGSPASSHPTAPLQPRGASSSGAQPLIIKGILFFAALLPKCSWCLTQFVSRTPAVILFLPPSLTCFVSRALFASRFAAPAAQALPVPPFPGSWESINPDDALRLHAHELGLFGLTRVNCTQTPTRRHTGALCSRKNHLPFGVTAAATCRPRGSPCRHALSV